PEALTCVGLGERPEAAEEGAARKDRGAPRRTADPAASVASGEEVARDDADQVGAPREQARQRADERMADVRAMEGDGERPGIRPSVSAGSVANLARAGLDIDAVQSGSVSRARRASAETTEEEPMLKALLRWTRMAAERRSRGIIALLESERAQGTVEYVGLILLVSMLMV